MAHLSPKHPVKNLFEVRSGQLCIGGQTVTELASRHATPFYAYEGQLIQQRIDELRQVLPERLHLHYAIKANPLPELVNFIAPLVDGLDVASRAEMTTALATDHEHISFAGPGKSVEELNAAVAHGVIMNVESETELSRLIEIAKKQATPARIALRVNPDFELKASGMKMAGGAKAFGIDAERIPAVIQHIKQHREQLNFLGFHIFSGSQNLKVEALVEAQQKTFELAARLTLEWGKPIQSLNIGGGLGIPYFPGESRLEIADIGNNLHELLASYQAEFGPTRVSMELGRYIVGEAGVYICQVSDIKASRGEKFIISNGGLHHHLAASGNFGQVIRKNYPVAIANKLDRATDDTAHVVGPLCTPLDILYQNGPIQAAEIGDLIVVYQSGAYGYTASPLLFLSHPAPKQLFL